MCNSLIHIFDKKKSTKTKIAKNLLTFTQFNLTENSVDFEKYQRYVNENGDYRNEYYNFIDSF